jgi:hypothetical protein
MPFEGTVDVAVWLTVRSVLLDTAVCGHIPVNDGLLRPIRITAPVGSLANPVFPAPTPFRREIHRPKLTHYGAGHKVCLTLSSGWKPYQSAECGGRCTCSGFT